MNMVKIVYHFRQTHTHQLTLHKRYIKNIKKTMQILIFHKHCIKKLKPMLIYIANTDLALTVSSPCEQSLSKKALGFRIQGMKTSPRKLQDCSDLK